jgi:hypothetical protein
MRYIDKYRYTKVADVDETVVPKQLTNMGTLDSVRSYITSIDFEKLDNKDPFDKLTCDQNIKITDYLDALAVNTQVPELKLDPELKNKNYF